MGGRRRRGRWHLHHGERHRRRAGRPGRRGGEQARGQPGRGRAGRAVPRSPPTSGSRTRRPGCCGSRVGGARLRARPTARRSPSSPVVVAMPQAGGRPAVRLAGQEARLERHAARQYQRQALRAGIVEPTHDAAGLSGLLSLAAAASGGGGDAQQATTARPAGAGHRSLGAAARPAGQKFPHSTDPTSSPAASGLPPLSEEDVVAYNATKPPIPLAALYLEPSPTPLDYPYAVMPGIDLTKAAAATVLLRAAAPRRASRTGWPRQSLRAPDGNGVTASRRRRARRARPARGTARRRPVGPPRVAWTRCAIDRAVSALVDRSPSRDGCSRVIDVSGSMQAPVPTAGNATRAQVTVAAASRGLNLFDDSWSVGLWTFSTELVGSRRLAGDRADQPALRQPGQAAAGGSPAIRPAKRRHRPVRHRWRRTRPSRTAGSPAGSIRWCCSPTGRTRTRTAFPRAR